MKFFRRLIAKIFGKTDTAVPSEPETVIETKVEKKAPEAETPSLPDFGSMTKLEMDVWARQEHGIKLDRRYTKENMVKEFYEKFAGDKDRE